MAACKETDSQYAGSANPFDRINITVGQEASTRSHYSTQDWLQIEWDVNDLVTIASDETQAPTTEAGVTKWEKKPSAIYKVTEPLDNEKAVEYDDLR